MQDLIRFTLVEWTALFYVFALSKFLKEINEVDHGGLGLLMVTGTFSNCGRWKAFFESFFYIGHFLGFIFFTALMTLTATLWLVPHWVISDYFGYPYQLTSTSIYAGFIWAFGSTTNASNREIQKSDDEVKFLRQKVIDLESRIL
jgi:hypothetical protein